MRPVETSCASDYAYVGALWVRRVRAHAAFCLCACLRACSVSLLSQMRTCLQSVNVRLRARVRDRVRVHLRMRACVRACACVRARACVCVRAWACVRACACVVRACVSA